MEEHLVKKILLIAPISPPVGGIAIWTERILDYYQLNQSDFNISHLNTALVKRRITDKSILNRIRFGFQDFLHVKRNLKAFLKKEKFSLAHITSSASLALIKDYFLIRFLKKKGVKVILHFRFGRIPSLSEKRNWEWKLLLKVCSLCETIIVLDSRSRDKLIENNILNVELLPNPISDKEINMYVPTKIEHDTSILFVGHVTKDKGVFDLVNAAINVEEIKKIKLIGPYEPDIYIQLKDIERNNNRLDILEFLGVQHKEKILEEMRESTIFVLPSFTEGFPNVILEAMSQSCFIIATNVGAIPDMLAENCGVCIPVNNSSILKEKIKHYLFDSNKRYEMGQAARRKVIKEYTMNSVIGEMENIWLKSL